MKKIVFVMLILMGVTVLAQRGEKGNKNYMKDLTPEQMATLQTKKATLVLDLTEGQQTQMKALLLEKVKARKAKMEKRKSKKEYGEKEELTSEEKYAWANERLDQQIAEKEKLTQILSDEQFEKWQKMRHRKGKQRNRKGNKEQGLQKRERK